MVSSLRPGGACSALDVGDEAVFVAFAERTDGIEGLGGAGHGAITLDGLTVGSNGSKRAGPGTISARLMAESAVPTASLMRRQCGRVGQ